MLSKYPQLSNTGPDWGMRCTEASINRSVMSRDAFRPYLMHHHRGWWNEMKQSEWDECGEMWNEICGRGKWEKPREKPTQTPFHLPPKPHWVTETQTWDPQWWEVSVNCLHHRATFQCRISQIPPFLLIKVTVPWKLRESSLFSTSIAHGDKLLTTLFWVITISVP